MAKTPYDIPDSINHQKFHDLMTIKIHNILLVSSLYDFFIFESDGILQEKLINEYQHHNISNAPRVRHVTTGKKALSLLNKFRFDVIISSIKIPDIKIETFINNIKSSHPEIPFILLAHATDVVFKLITPITIQKIDNLFIWNGDHRLLFAINKLLEDKYNVDNDIKQGDVRVIIVIEDSPRDYSVFLPIIYSEIMMQTRELIEEGLNFVDKMTRLRLRPKILLATNYEEAISLFKKYNMNTLGIISDVSFPKNGKIHDTAGFTFAKEIKKISYNIPILLQSTNIKNKALASDHGTHFIYKNSNKMHAQLHQFMLEHFGFGDFIFRDKSKKEIARASSIKSLEKLLHTVPDESLEIHAKNNHFSHWLFARGEFKLAKALEPFTLNDYPTLDGVRNHIITMINVNRQRHQEGLITDFNKKSFDTNFSFVKLGSGSMGGKARSLAFINSLLSKGTIKHKFQDVKISVPKLLIIASDEYDKFITANKLTNLLHECDNKTIIQNFLSAKVSKKIFANLKFFLSHIKNPITVRSSSLFEDSQNQPFAGIYETYMLPNNHKDLNIRLQSLCNAIKAIYASVFYQEAKTYFKNTSFRHEEEKMSIIIQEIVGDSHNNYFYPLIAGVAQSYNYYPISHMKPRDGIANIVFGFGKAVVEGNRTFRFCPKYPGILPQFPTQRDLLKYTQKKFYALNMDSKIFDITTINKDERFPLLNISDAEKHETLKHVAGVYSPENDIVYDGIFRDGIKIINFSNILKNNTFPLANILTYLLKVLSSSFACSIEMEFAVNVYEDKPSEFYILQARPFITKQEGEVITINKKEKKNAICYSSNALGNSSIDNIFDIVYVIPEAFRHDNTLNIAQEMNKINQKLTEENRPYLLIGIGRWGSTDRSLGIPVTWPQISGAKVIIETSKEEKRIDPSNGTHFFHNLTACKTAYITIGRKSDGNFLDWDWLGAAPIYNKTENICHIRLESPIHVKVNGRTSEAIIVKPD